MSGSSSFRHTNSRCEMRMRMHIADTEQDAAIVCPGSRCGLDPGEPGFPPFTPCRKIAVTRLDDHAIAHPLSPSQPSLPCDALRCAAPRSPLTIQHGFYGSMMNGLGSCVGAIGMIPCCPLPNPFKNVGE
jgi:hypothetical protein